MSVHHVSRSYSSLDPDELHDDDLEARDYDKIGKDESMSPDILHSRQDQIIEALLIVLCILGHGLLVIAFSTLVVLHEYHSRKHMSVRSATLGPFTSYVYKKIVNSPDLVFKVRLSNVHPPAFRNHLY